MDRTCTVHGCSRPYLAKGMCSLHYQRYKTGYGERKPPHTRQCVIDGCASRQQGTDGLCGKHAMRKRRYGDPHYVTSEDRRRELSREAQLENVEYVKPTTYRKYFGRHHHRVAAEEMLGRKLIKGEIVHHIDGNRHNNSHDNLQVMTQAEHARIHMLERYRDRS